jgi:hypothetical protein
VVPLIFFGIITWEMPTFSIVGKLGKNLVKPSRWKLAESNLDLNVRLQLVLVRRGFIRSG